MRASILNLNLVFVQEFKLNRLHSRLRGFRNMDSKRFPYIIRLAACLLVLVLTVLIFYHLKVVLVPLLFSIIVAILLYPACLRVEKWGASRGLSSFLTVFIASLILGFIAYLIFAQLLVFFKQLPEISVRVSALVEDIKEFAARKLHMNKAVVADKIQQQLVVLENSSGSMLGGSLGSLSGIFINLFLIPLYIFFLLYYRHFFIEFFYKIFHDSEKDLIDETLDKIKQVVKGYLFGLFLDVLIIGFVNSLALYLIGVWYPLILGFIISIFCIIPYIGMIVGSLVALLTAFVTTTSSWQPPVAFAALWFIHIIDSNILAPTLIGSKVSINPLMSIMMIFMFGEMWGLPGLFLAFPLTAIIKVIFDTVPALKPYGFLLGEPEKYHLKRHSLLHIKKLHNLIDRRKNKVPPPVIPGEIEDVDNPPSV